MPSDTHRIALTTAGSDEQATQIARALVERRLAACVNVVGGVCSFYRWKGEVTRDDEKLLVIKTTEQRLAAVSDAIREIHTYEVPEFVVLAVDGGDPDYLRWIEASVRDDQA